MNSKNYNYCNLNQQPQMQNNYAPQARRVFQRDVNPVVQQVRVSVCKQIWGLKLNPLPRKNSWFNEDYFELTRWLDDDTYKGVTVGRMAREIIGIVISSFLGCHHRTIDIYLGPRLPTATVSWHRQLFPAVWPTSERRRSDKGKIHPKRWYERIPNDILIHECVRVKQSK